MIVKTRLAQWAVLVGGSLGILVVGAVGAGQLNLGDVIRGNMPLRIAVALSGNAFPFLVLILLVCLVAILTAMWRKMSQLRAGLTWLSAAGVLAFCVYYSRFSVGPLLIPTTALFAIGGLTALSHVRLG